MLKNYNKYKVLKVFLDAPTESHRLREISRASGVFPKSVMNYLKEFETDEIIKRFEKNKIPLYTALRDNERFKLYKKLSIIYELNVSGFIEELWNKVSPDAIILYGSYAKGESVEDSDIDIFVIGKEKEINIEIYEKTLGKKIHLMYEAFPKNISNELKNNLANGIVMKGYFKVF